MFNERVALWSGWTWALLPYTVYWAVRFVWHQPGGAAASRYY